MSSCPLPPLLPYRSGQHTKPFNPGLDRFNQNGKRRKFSTEGALTACSTFPRVKTAIPCVLYPIKHWLIAWSNEYYRPQPSLNLPCLRVWKQLTYFLSFSTSSVFPLHFAMSEIFYFARGGGGGIVNNFWPTLVTTFLYTDNSYVIFGISHNLLNMETCLRI